MLGRQHLGWPGLIAPHGQEVLTWRSPRPCCEDTAFCRQDRQHRQQPHCTMFRHDRIPTTQTPLTARAELVGLPEVVEMLGHVPGLLGGVDLDHPLSWVDSGQHCTRNQGRGRGPAPSLRCQGPSVECH